MKYPQIVTVIILTTLCFRADISIGATHYVSPTGSDGSAGTSQGTAWKTIAKVNATTFSSGDRVLFARGGTWTTDLTVGQNGVTYATYGTGAKGAIFNNVKVTMFGGTAVFDGFTMTGDSFFDVWSSSNTSQNCVFDGVTPGETACILFRGGVRNNTVRFNTIVAKSGACLGFYGGSPGLKFYGNIMKGTVTSGGAAGDVAYADYNFYDATPSIMGRLKTY